MEGKYTGVSDWTQKKLNLLSEYLQAYSTILNAQVRKGWFARFEYVDCFAGEGRYEDPDTGEYVDGSPRIALRIEPPFTVYHFVEIDQRRAEHLEAVVREFPNRDIRLYPKRNANDFLVNELIPSFARQHRKRGFVLLDPWGLDVEWNTIEHLAAVGTLEIFVNFSLVGVQRNVLRRDPSRITGKHRERMRRIWGSDDWEQKLYKPEPTLFGDELKKIENSSRVLAEAYRQRLQGEFKHCPPPAIMRNSNRSPIYALQFASHKPVAEKIMNWVLTKLGEV